MRVDNKLIIANDDGHGGFYTGDYASVEGLERPIERYRGTTLGVLEWGISLGTKVNCLSEHFELFGTGLRTDLAHARRGDRRVAENLSAYARQGIDPLTVVANKAHEVGIQIHASIRVNPDYDPIWMGEWLPNTYNDTFYFQHEHLRIQNKDGSKGWHLSYTYEEMRERKALLVQELMRYPIDGINLDFLRHPPFVGYDPPLIESFIKEHGQDPRGLADDDPRWLACQCAPMTAFLRTVRRIVGGKAVSARVDRRYYLAQGLDIETWLREGLVDILIMAEEGFGGYIFDLRPFVDMAHGRCRVLFGEEAVLEGEDTSAEEDKALAEAGVEDTGIGRKMLTKEAYCQRALAWYAQGADGVHIFNDQHNYEVLAVLGDPVRCRQVLGLRGKS